MIKLSARSAENLRVGTRLTRISLRAQFGIMTLVLLTLLGLSLGQFLKAQIEARARASAEESAVLVARAGVQANLTSGEVRRGFTERRLDQLDRRLHVQGFSDSGIERVKIFNREPKIIYSDDRNTIGKSAADSTKVRRALRGEVVSEFVEGVNHSGRGERTLEVMVPLRFGDSPAPAGVYEVYLSYTHTEAAIRSDTLAMYGVIFGGLVVLYAALYRIVAVASRRLRYQASHDALTGLPNRALLNDRIERALAAAARAEEEVAVLLIDLDRFKEINDTLGHGWGDRLLQRVAERLAQTVRRGDSVARFGGDEFAVLLPAAADRGQAQEVADRLRDALHQRFETDGITIDVEASIGIAMSPDHGTTAEELLRNADIAMYSAKELKAGASFFCPEDHVDALSHLRVLGDLRRALDSGDELFVHYQPKFALDDHRLLGVEALVRWQHPERGLVSPADFISIAEGTGLILPLTERVLHCALAQGRRWLEEGRRVPIAVNLSTRCLLDSSFPELVERVLAEHDLSPDLLRLEITESAVLVDPARAINVLQRLRAMGIHLSIDDFGTGYTSMAHLRRLPIDELKIDRSFVIGMTKSAHDSVLVRTAIDLAHNMGLTVVAEGVEGAEHVRALRELDCDVAQGYYFARPMAAENLVTLLDSAEIPGRGGPEESPRPRRPTAPTA